jgi:hypothetical protein
MGSLRVRVRETHHPLYLVVRFTFLPRRQAAHVVDKLQIRSSIASSGISSGRDGAASVTREGKYADKWKEDGARRHPRYKDPFHE